MKAAGCPLCEAVGGELVFAHDRYRVVRADEPGFPGFYRVVWTDHVAEFSDLDAADRALCMEAVACTERVLRQELGPAKINLAALGNMVAHLHWHVIARFEWDSHFPGAVWAEARRPADPARLDELAGRIRGVDQAVKAAFRTAP